MLAPTMALFGDEGYAHALEVPVGWRKIDLVAVDKRDQRWVAVELKVSAWKDALTQAHLNHVVADRTYIAIWHRHLPVVLTNRKWFDHYRVGVISVSETGAEVVFEFDDNESDGMRSSNRERVMHRLARRDNKVAGFDGPIPVLSA
jgi:hypothetical protein